MAEIKITALPIHTSMDQLDLLAIVDDPGGSPTTKRMSFQGFLNGIEQLLQLSAIPQSTDTFLIIDNGLAKFIEMNEFIKARYVGLPVGTVGTSLETGNRQSWFKVPVEMSGMNLVSVEADVTTAPTGAALSIAVYNFGQTQDMLSVDITIDIGDTSSDVATTAPVINAGTDDIVDGEIVGIDIDTVGSTEPGDDLLVTLGFDWP